MNRTAAGLAAVRLGAREAVARGCALRIVHAFTWPETAPPGQNPEGQDYGTARHAAARMVEHAVTVARRATPAPRVRGLVVDGPPARVLLQQSRAAQLLVLGEDDLARVPHLTECSVLLQTVSRARCPVVVARGVRPPTGPLLAGVDGSAASLAALRHAAAEARRRHLPVEVAHVVERPDPAARARARGLLDAAVAAVPELPAHRVLLLTGDPVAELVRASRHARMVIVGPRGADGSPLLGPVAHELLRRCVSPTLFVHGGIANEHTTAGTVPSAGVPAS
ncbi:universal stress protein [Krasilnikovia cinnamomea]|uniref:universal stress protein n=1 Tax=Krasilnikovia cinnamomea TaxID=349313 RepID=UPI0013EEFF26|nr:universal stress protein [Krasilnikovia cinnamomea]